MYPQADDVIMTRPRQEMGIVSMQTLDVLGLEHARDAHLFKRLNPMMSLGIALILRRKKIPSLLGIATMRLTHTFQGSFIGDKAIFEFGDPAFVFETRYTGL